MAERPSYQDGILDAWGFRVADREAYESWAHGGKREALLEQVALQGGWMRWMLPAQLCLLGMGDPHYLVGMRWLVASRCGGAGHDGGSAASRCRDVAAEIERDLGRTCPGHPEEAAIKDSVRDILTVMCGGRNLPMGYTQGQSFAAALLSRVMPRADAFWCLAALMEHALPHLFTGGSLQGILVDCEVLDWLVRRLSPGLAGLLDATATYSPAVLYTAALCSLLAQFGLPGDAVLQLWRAILSAAVPRLMMLRLLAALHCAAAPAAADAGLGGDPEDLASIAVGLRRRFAAWYDMEPIIGAAASAAEQVLDAALEERLRTAEGRIRSEAAEQSARRSRCVVGGMDGGRALPEDALRRLRAAWRGGPDDEISADGFAALLTAALGGGPGAGAAGPGGAAPPGGAEAARLFAELGAGRPGGVSLRAALVGLALLLGAEPARRIDAIFAFLDQDGNGRISREEFEGLARLTKDAGDPARAGEMFEQLDADGSGDLDKMEFRRALLVLPSLASRAFGLADAAELSGRPQGPCSRPAWTADTASNACQGCSLSFTCARRRHHCRACGRLLCSRCSPYRLPLAIVGYEHPVRTCTQCFGALSPA